MSDIFSTETSTLLSELGLIAFIVVFFAAMAWVFVARDRAWASRGSRMALDDGRVAGRDARGTTRGAKEDRDVE